MRGDEVMVGDDDDDLFLKKEKTQRRKEDTDDRNGGKESMRDPFVGGCLWEEHYFIRSLRFERMV